MPRISDSSVGRLALVGLMALLVVDVLLVALAFRPDAAGASAVSATHVPLRTSSSRSATGATTSGTATATAFVPVSDVIAAVDDQHAWRATLGTCKNGGAKLSVTNDGGRTWTDRTPPAAALGRVQPVSALRGFVIGAATGCKAGEYDTTDGAKSWQNPRGIDGGWSRVPGGQHPDLVITPRQADARPCSAGPVIDLARITATRAVAACADGSLVGSADAGSTWTPLATVQGSLSVAARNENGTPVVYVARQVAGCAGVEVAKLAGESTSRIACIPTSLDGAEGRVSLSVVGAGGWLSVSGATWRSGGDLASWSAA